MRDISPAYSVRMVGSPPPVRAARRERRRAVLRSRRARWRAAPRDNQGVRRCAFRGDRRASPAMGWRTAYRPIL